MSTRLMRELSMSLSEIAASPFAVRYALTAGRFSSRDPEFRVVPGTRSVLKVSPFRSPGLGAGTPSSCSCLGVFCRASGSRAAYECELPHECATSASRQGWKLSHELGAHEITTARNHEKEKDLVFCLVFWCFLFSCFRVSVFSRFRVGRTAFVNL